MSNSKLATYVRISPFKNSPRNKPISKITWHHMAGVLSVEQFGNIVTTPGREMSATYAIGSDGRIGRYLDESDRPWTSSSPANDNMAITFEISNSKMGEPWPISDKVMAAAIDLTVDCCYRNGIKKLVYTGNANGNFTFHCYFAPTGCPGTYIKSKADYIVKTVNARLDKLNGKTPTPTPSTFKTYTAKIVAGTPIYKEAGGKQVGVIKTTSVYTITAEKTVDKVKYGKLKSGAGWVKTSKMTKTTIPTTSSTSTIKKGDWVKVLKNKTYDGGTFVIYASKYKVLELSGKRAVISSDGKNVTAAVSTDNLKKI